MICLTLGFFIVLGTVGTMDFDPNFPLWQALVQSAIGVTLLYLGTKQVNQKR